MGTAWRSPAALASAAAVLALLLPAHVQAATSNAAMAYDTVRGVSVLYGGSTVTAVNADTWEWDGASWNHRSPATSPPPMSDAAMVYDSARARMLLFGAFNLFGLMLPETWEYDGTSWIQDHPATSPSPRTGPRLAFDSSRERAVLFGGHDPNLRRGADTWDGYRSYC